MKIIPSILILAYTLAIIGCSGPDTEPGKVIVTAVSYTHLTLPTIYSV